MNAFLIYSAIRQARDVQRMIYALPGSIEYQHELVRRKLRDGCGTIQQIAQESGLDIFAVHSSIYELINRGEVEEIETKNKRNSLFVLVGTYAQKT